MRFMIGIIIAGVVVVAFNMFFISVALDTDAGDPVVTSYATETR